MVTLILQRVTYIFSLSILVACGGQHQPANILKSVQVKTSDYHLGGDLRSILNAELGLTGVELPDFEVPITGVDKNKKKLGTLKLQKSNGGNSMLTMDISLVQVLEAMTTADSSKLPNQSMTPLADTQGVKAFEIDQRANVYVGIKQNARVLGVAIQVDEIHKFKGVVGENQLTIPFRSKSKKFNGVMGIYLGATPKESGIVLFLDASREIPYRFIFEKS